MKKPTDKDILKGNGKRKTQKDTSLSTFRKQFDEYHHAKAAGRTDTPLVCRPYSQVFHHAKIEE